MIVVTVGSAQRKSPAPFNEQGNRIWSLRLLKADGASWRSGAINSDRGCQYQEEPASVRSFARSKGSSASNHLPNFSYAIALTVPHVSYGSAAPRRLLFHHEVCSMAAEISG